MQSRSHAFLSVEVGLLVLALGACQQPKQPDRPGPFGLPAIPGDSRSDEELVAAAGTTDAETRAGAVRSLGKRGATRTTSAAIVVPALLRAAKDDAESVRAIAVRYLGEIHVQPAEVVPVLTEALADSGRPVRMSAAYALASFGVDAAPATAPLLAARLDKEKDVRWAVAIALRKLPGWPFSLPPLPAGLTADDARARLADLAMRPEAAALFDAVQHDDGYVVELLLATGIDPNVEKAPGMTPLGHGSMDPTIGQALLAAGANPNVQTSDAARVAGR